MKTPSHKMSKIDLAEWIFTNDYTYWAEQYLQQCERSGHYPIDAEEEVDEVFDLIVDELHRCPSDYQAYIMYADNEVII